MVKMALKKKSVVSDTPLTNAAIKNVWTGAKLEFVPPDFARQLERELAAMCGIAKFGALCFAEHRREMSELDGGWLHDKAKECGLIEGRLVTQEMWDGCGSVHCECDVGDTCYFPTDTGKAALESQQSDCVDTTA